MSQQIGKSLLSHFRVRNVKRHWPHVIYQRFARSCSYDARGDRLLRPVVNSAFHGSEIASLGMLSVDDRPRPLGRFSGAAKRVSSYVSSADDTASAIASACPCPI